MPYRGRPNASYLVPLTMRAMAEVRGADLGNLRGRRLANTDAAFGGALVAESHTLRPLFTDERLLTFTLRGGAVCDTYTRRYGFVTDGRDRDRSDQCRWQPELLAIAFETP